MKLEMIILALILGLGLGGLAVKYMTDKQVVIYKNLPIAELAKQSGEKDWVKVKVLQKFMKNKDFDVNIFTFIPWYLVIIFVFLTFGILAPTREVEKKEKKK